jgi:hypothetical protein
VIGFGLPASRRGCPDWATTAIELAGTRAHVRAVSDVKEHLEDVTGEVDDLGDNAEDKITKH